jgi:hypothetical protein
MNGGSHGMCAYLVNVTIVRKDFGAMTMMKNTMPGPMPALEFNFGHQCMTVGFLRRGGDQTHELDDLSHSVARTQQEVAHEG